MTFYRGKAEIKNNQTHIVITLNDYKLYNNFTIQVTPIDKYSNFYVTEVENGKFKVYGQGKFYYLVYSDYEDNEDVEFAGGL